MKIFISWSGQRSHQVAKLLDGWIQCVIQAVDPWLSSKDIDRGSLWFSEITNQLAHTHNGIICLTKSNVDKPWILFESGALAKGLTSSRVFTFLIDLKPKDVQDPLAQFNHTVPTKDSLYLLVRSINNGLTENSLREEILSNVFETYWPQFERDFKDIIKNTPEEEIKEERPKDDLLSEVLYSVRGIDRRIRHLEMSKQSEKENTVNVERLPLSFIDRMIKKQIESGMNDNEIFTNLMGKAPMMFIKQKLKEYRNDEESRTES